jgi:hypothetical protein
MEETTSFIYAICCLFYVRQQITHRLKCLSVIYTLATMLNFMIQWRLSICGIIMLSLISIELAGDICDRVLNQEERVVMQEIQINIITVIAFHTVWIGAVYFRWILLP